MKRSMFLGATLALASLSSAAVLAADASNASGNLPVPATTQGSTQNSGSARGSASNRTRNSTSSLPSTSSAGLPDFNTIDTNNDGLLSRAEAASVPGLSEQFSKLDKNHDGNLSQDELSSFVASGTGTGASSASTGTPSSGTVGLSRGGNSVAVNPDKGTARGSMSTPSNKQFGQLDANGDGKLTKDEVAGNASIARRFDSMDTNKDGQVDAQEFAMGLRATNPSGSNDQGSSSASNQAQSGTDKAKAKAKQGKDRVTGENNSGKSDNTSSPPSG